MTNWKACSGDGTQDSGLKPRDPQLLAALRVAGPAFEAAGVAWDAEKEDSL